MRKSSQWTTVLAITRWKLSAVTQKRILPLRLLRIQAIGERDTACARECCMPRANCCYSAMPTFPAPIEEADKLLDAIAGGADIAIGSRWLQRDLQTQRQPFYRQAFGRIFNLLLRLTLGLTFKDTQCGFKAFTRGRGTWKIFPLQKIERWGFDPELLYLARKLKFRVGGSPGGMGPLRRDPHQSAARR